MGACQARSAVAAGADLVMVWGGDGTMIGVAAPTSISVDGGPEQRLAGRTVLVANVGMLVAGLMLVPEARPDDGSLDVLVIDPTTPTDWIRTTAGIITRTGRDTDPSRIRFRGTEVRIATGHVHKRQIDGDLVTPGSGLLVRVRPGGLVVRVPQ